MCWTTMFGYKQRNSRPTPRPICSRYIFILAYFISQTSILQLGYMRTDTMNRDAAQVITGTNNCLNNNISKVHGIWGNMLNVCDHFRISEHLFKLDARYLFPQFLYKTLYYALNYNKCLFFYLKINQAVRNQGGASSKLKITT